MAVDRKTLISHIPLKYLMYGAALNVVDMVRSPFRKRFTWKVTDVGNSLFPDADLRTFYEIQNIREILAPHVTGKVARASEVGCGYGRITPCLFEFASEVVGFEREPSLVAMARDVVRDVNIIKVNRLAELSQNGSFDIQMICTVLQHLSDAESKEVIAAMKAAASPAGLILLVENTDETGFATIGDPSRGDSFLSRPRSIGQYVADMAPFTLVAQAERRLEKGNDMAGHLMLFRAPGK